MPSVTPELSDVITEDTADLPRAIQEAIDVVSLGLGTTYESAAARDAAWEDVPKGVGAVAYLLSDPRAFYLRSAETGAWHRCTPDPTRARGTVTVSFAAGSKTSSIGTVAFPAGAFKTPPRVDTMRESIPGGTGILDSYVIAGTRTQSGCQIQAVLDPAPSAATVRTLNWYAEEW